MPLSEIERLVTELLNTGEMNDDTKADLERILAEARAGESYPDDVEYLKALHARILSAPPTDASASVVAEVIDQADTLRLENERLRAELDAARQTIAELEARLAPKA